MLGDVLLNGSALGFQLFQSRKACNSLPMMLQERSCARFQEVRTNDLQLMEFNTKKFCIILVKVDDKEVQSARKPCP